MSGSAACTQVKVPVRFTPMMRSHFSAVISRVSCSMTETVCESVEGGVGYCSCSVILFIFEMFFVTSNGSIDDTTGN